MPSLYNRDSKQVERITDNDVEGALSTGRYGLTPEYVVNEGKRIRVISPDGKYGSVPAEKFRNYLGLGYRLANEADKWAATSGGSMPAAIGLGALSGVSLGASNWLIAQAGGADAVEALKKAHPTATTAAELTTALGTALLGNIGAIGEAGVAAKTALTGMELVKAGEVAGVVGSAAEGGSLLRNTIKAVEASKGWVGGATGAMSYATTRLTDPLARTLIAELTGGTKLGLVTASVLRGASLMPGAAVEGGIWGVNQALTEHALGDPREVGEMLTDIVWPNMGYSAATAGVLGTAGALIGGAASKLAKRAAAKLASADELTLSFAEKVLARHYNLSTSNMTKLRESAGDAFPTLFDETLMGDGSIFQKRVTPDAELSSVTAKEAHARAALAHATAGEFVGNAYARAQQVAEGVVPRSAVAQLENQFAEAMRMARRAGRNTQAQREAVSMANELKIKLDTVANEGPWPSVKSMVKKVQEVINQIPDEGDGRLMRRHLQDFVTKRGDKFIMPFTGEEQYTLQKLKQVYGGPKVWNASGEEAIKAKMFRTLWGIMQDEALHKAGKTLSPGEYAVLERANSNYSKLGDVVGVLEKIASVDPASKELEQLMRRWGYMSQWGTASAMKKALVGGAGVGALGGGIPGAVLGAGVGAATGYAGAKMVNYGTGKLASALAPMGIAVVSARAGRLGALAEKVAAFDGRVQGAIQKWLRMAPGARLSGHMVGAKVLRQLGRDSDARRALKKVRAQVADLQEPESMGRYLEESLGGMRSIAPQAALHSAAAVSRGVAEMQRIFAPEQQMRQPSMQPGLHLEPDISESRMEEIGLRVGAVTRPLDTIDEVLSGKATQPQIESFVRTYPELWAYVIKSVSMQLAQHKEPLRHDQKMLLAKLGFRDWETPVWLPQQAASIYSAPGSMQSPMGAAAPNAPNAIMRPPSQRAFTALSRLDSAFQTKEATRSAEGIV